MAELKKNKKYLKDYSRTVRYVRTELDDGLKVLRKSNRKTVTFLGGHIAKEKSKEFKLAKELAYRLGKKEYAIISGGGPGIMRAANEGATKAGTESIGFKASLLKGEQVTKNIYTDTYSFRFLFTRRFLLAIKSNALIFFPGGYGTFNELFEYLTLMQTDLVDRVPVILVGSDYWEGLIDWMKKNAKKYMPPPGLKLITIEDDLEKIIKIIEKQ